MFRSREACRLSLITETRSSEAKAFKALDREISDQVSDAYADAFPGPRYEGREAPLRQDRLDSELARDAYEFLYGSCAAGSSISSCASCTP
ncbi:hypothetical protein [Spongiactinospora sp. 9N601]|uniref:hypothetical protein n=1 Tax=Spongiactinospora sp. 9N601 TaxID=3375149 RepID=UPI0037B8ED93